MTRVMVTAAWHGRWEWRCPECHHGSVYPSPQFEAACDNARYHAYRCPAMVLAHLRAELAALAAAWDTVGRVTGSSALAFNWRERARDLITVLDRLP